MLGLRADLQALQRAYKTCAAAVAEDQHAQAIRSSIIQSIEKEFRLKLMRWLEEGNQAATLRRRCDEAPGRLRTDTVVARGTAATLAEAEPPAEFAETLSPRSWRSSTTTTMSVRNQNRAHQVQRPSTRCCTASATSRAQRRGRAGRGVDAGQAPGSTASTHRWFKWVTKREHFELWKREMDALHGGDSTGAARALAHKHMQDARGRPPKQRA